MIHNKTKKGLSLILMLCMLLTMAPKPAFGETTAILGANTINLNQSKNIYKETYILSTQEQMGDVSWRIGETVEGVLLFTSDQINGRKLDIFVYKDKVNVQDFELNATYNGQTYTKQIIVNKPTGQAILDTEINSSETDQELVKIDTFNYRGNFILPEGVNSRTFTYDISFIDEHFQSVSASLEANERLLEPGIEIYTLPEEGRFEITIDRFKLEHPINNLTVQLKGKTDAGENFTVSITARIEALGVIGENASHYKVYPYIDASSSFVVLNGQNESLQTKVDVLNHNEMVAVSGLTYKVTPKVGSAISIDANGLLTIPKDTPSGEYSFTAEYKGVESKGFFQVIQFSEDNIISSFDGASVEEFVIGRDGDIYIESQKPYQVTYNVHPHNTSIQINYMQIENRYRLSIAEDSPTGWFEIKPDSSLISNTLMLHVTNPNEMPLDYHSIGISMPRNIINLPKAGEVITPTVAQYYHFGMPANTSISFQVQGNPAGISLSGNNLVVNSNANVGTYKLMAFKTDNPQISTVRFFEITDEAIPEQNSYNIQSFLEVEDENNIPIPFEGKSNYAIQTSVLHKGKISLEPTIARLDTSYNGLQISNGVLSISNNVSTGQYRYTVSLVNNPSVQIKKTFTLVKGTASGDIVIPNISMDGARFKVPEEETLKVPYTMSITVNGQINNSRAHKLSLIPSDKGVTINTLGKNIEIPKYAEIGSYALILEMEDGSNQKSIFNFEVNDGEDENGDPVNGFLIDIISPSNVFIPKIGTNNYNIGSTVKRDGVIIDTTVLLEIVEPQNGVNLSPTGKLEVTSRAAKGSFTINAFLEDNPDIKTTKIVYLIPEGSDPVIPGSEDKSIVITSPSRIHIPETGSEIIQMTAQIKKGNEEIFETIDWSLLEKSDDALLSKTGILTVPSGTREQAITVIATLKSDKTVTAQKDIMLREIIDSPDVPAKIILKGFENDYKESLDKELFSGNASGNIFKITAHTYNEKGEEIKGMKVNVGVDNYIKGIHIEPTEKFNEFHIYANGVFENMFFDLISYTDGSFSNTVLNPVEIKKPRHLEAKLSFSKKRLVPREKLQTTSLIKNNSSESLDVILVMAVYENNQMTDIQTKPAKIKNGKSAELSLTVQLPYDVSGITVKSFVVTGTDALTSSRLITRTIEAKQ